VVYPPLYLTPEGALYELLQVTVDGAPIQGNTVIFTVDAALNPEIMGIYSLAETPPPDKSALIFLALAGLTVLWGNKK